MCVWGTDCCMFITVWILPLLWRVVSPLRWVRKFSNGSETNKKILHCRNKKFIAKWVKCVVVAENYIKKKNSTGSPVSSLIYCCLEKKLVKIFTGHLKYIKSDQQVASYADQQHHNRSTTLASLINDMHTRGAAFYYLFSMLESFLWARLGWQALCIGDTH